MPVEAHPVDSGRFDIFSDQNYKCLCSFRMLQFFPLFMLLLERSLRRQRHRWDDSLRKDLWDIGCEAGNWVEQAEDRVRWWAVVMMVMNSGVP
jgi:hypothetical protein